MLRNRVGTATVETLADAEADLSFARALQLLDSPVAATNDLHELQAIHRHLFQDLYDWAGDLRTVDVRKNVPGADYFLPYGFIERASGICFAELAADEFLVDLPRDFFVERLAYHYEKINYIHPFREGNGRTQRIFWNRVALEAGWQLDWRPVHGEENHLAARIGSDEQDLGPLISMFDKIVTEPDASEAADWSADEIRRLSINRSDDRGTQA
ncbi:MAG: cell filamentation protein [Microbacterium sp.]|uniref:Fic/DOC family protein n=1 Tax=Microbacterium sp. TaxID=51671 RepID=UPI0026220B5C|nr:Fic family protein [Microbacterium sp.]MDF2558679.1 cell filamentation protein [Microbacterium sp.]